MNIRELRGFASYYRQLVRFAPFRFALGCALTVASAFLAGASLLLVIPLLHYTGWLPGGAQGGLIGGLLQHLPTAEGRAPLFVTMTLYVLIVVLSSGLAYWQQGVMYRLDLLYQFRLRRDLNEAIANCEWSHLVTRRLQQAQHMVNVGLGEMAALTMHSIRMTANALVLVVYFAISLAVSVPLTLASTGLALGLFLIHSRGKAFLLGKESLLINQRLYEELNRFLDGVKLAKSGNLTETYVARYDSLIREEQRYMWSFMRGEAAARFSFQVTIAMIIAAVFLVAVQVLKAPAASLLAFLLLLSRLMSHVMGMLESLRRAINGMPAHTEMRRILEDLHEHREAPTGAGRLRLDRSIRLMDVHFLYPGSVEAGLRGVSCEIFAGRITVVTGASGAGKTTLADVLLGLLVPQDGTVRVDEDQLTSANVAGWRESVSYVPQDPFLFHDTIRANLTWAEPGADDARIWRALEDASAAEFVRRLPDGLDAPVGDKGGRFSGGERQRLALARALLGEPDVLILDEVTSSLDAVSEEAVHAALRRLRGKVTIIFISHRPKPLELADYVLVLEGGRVVRSGPSGALTEAPTGRK